ncbi:hypothetical protein [Polynucleobacter sp.]|uniref:hypothetical protein n=1 Tax=Polynucleobacter sp. TaxID=2029855 RepID=UPI003F6A2ECA
MKNSIHATDQPLNRALGLSFQKHPHLRQRTPNMIPSKQMELRSLFWELNIGYTIQENLKTGEELGFYCVATSYLRKDSAMERIREFVDAHLLPYEVIDGSGLTFFVHDHLNN